MPCAQLVHKFEHGTHLLLKAPYPGWHYMHDFTSYGRLMQYNYEHGLHWSERDIPISTCGGSKPNPSEQ